MMILVHKHNSTDQDEIHELLYFIYSNVRLKKHIFHNNNMKM